MAFLLCRARRTLRTFGPSLTLALLKRGPLFLNLKATAGPWMDKVLQLKPKSWFYHSGTVPFLQEVREAILKAQSDKDYLTKRSAIVLQLRGKVFKVQNDLRSVRLVFEKSRA